MTEQRVSTTSRWSGETVRCRAWLWPTDVNLDDALERFEALRDSALGRPKLTVWYFYKRNEGVTDGSGD